MLNDQELLRYSRHLLLEDVGETGQQALKNAKVLIIGMGGLGCPLLTYLVSSGVNNIGIVDHDRVEISNLIRQILFNPSDM